MAKVKGKRGKPATIPLCKVGDLSISMDSRQYIVTHGSHTVYYTTPDGVGRYLARVNLHKKAEKVKWGRLVEAFDNGVVELVDELRDRLPPIKSELTEED